MYLHIGSCSKLTVYFCGPFRIIDKIVSVAYRPTFPSIVKFIDIFHISLLKKYVKDADHVID